ncbi:MAG: DUF4012 domain-containing protein [Candidatus Dojkabacteria bacterium]
MGLFDKNKPSNHTKLIIFLTILFLIIVGLFLFFVLIPLQRINEHVSNIQITTNNLILELSQKDISKIDTRFENLKVEVSAIDDEISQFEILNSIVLFKGYYNNLTVVRKITNDVNALLDNSLPDIKDVLSKEGYKTTDDTTPIVDSEASLDSISKNLPSYLALYKKIEPDLLVVLADFKSIDMNYVTEVGGLKEKLSKVNDFVDEYPTLSSNVIGFIENLPSLIGSDKEVSYLIILQNEAEKRAAGGITTAVGNAVVKDGEFIKDISLQDTLNLQEYLWQMQRDGIIARMPHDNIYGQDFLMYPGVFRCGYREARVQDVMQYPDLFESMSLFTDYYDLASENDSSEWPGYDNAVLLNFTFAQNLIALVQPITVEGFDQPVTADNLFSFIKSETDAPKYHGSADRKQVIQQIGNAIKTKLFGLPTTELPKLINFLIHSFQAKDIAFYSKDDASQKFFDDYGLSGRTVREYTGDYFQLNEAQNCSLKLNKWVRDTVYQNVSINNNGSIGREVKVKWRQPQILDSTIPGGQYDVNLTFAYAAWIRYILPNGSQNITSDGYDRSGYLEYDPQIYHDEVFDKQVSDNVLWFDHRRLSDADPIEKEEMNVSYTLPDSINYNTDGKYTLIIQKDPGKSWGEDYNITITYAGQSYNVTFILDRDKLLTFKNGIITVDNYDKSLDWVNTLLNRIPWDSIKKE